MSAQETPSGGRSAAAKETDDGFYEEIEHTADLALKCGGRDLAALFRHAALGTYRLMGIEKAPGTGGEATTVVLEAPDVESLLVDWLSELTYLAEARDQVFEEMRFETLSATQLDAKLLGAKIQHLDRAIKAVTYHDLRVEKSREGFTAMVVFDV